MFRISSLNKVLFIEDAYGDWRLYGILTISMRRFNWRGFISRCWCDFKNKNTWQENWPLYTNEWFCISKSFCDLEIHFFDFGMSISKIHYLYENLKLTDNMYAILKYCTYLNCTDKKVLMVLISQWSCRSFFVCLAT